MFNVSDIKKIKNGESRKNFEDVLQSYYSKNYKASILLLYNLLINDLYSKLKLMADKEYVNCQNDLDKIDEIIEEEKSSQYSIVEEKIYKVYVDKNILNHSTIDSLAYFKKIRNKCAHPSFFKEYNYSPTDEETFMFINCIYNDILIVDAFFKEPYEIIKSDVENYNFPDITSVMIGISSFKKDIEDVKDYFSVKYFNYMTDNNFIKLFKSLIRLIFVKKNDNTTHSQYRHYLILSSMLEFIMKIGKIQILNNIFDWNTLNDNLIYDENEENNFNNEWFALSFLYDICQYSQIFIDEIYNENPLVYNILKNNVYKNMSYFLEHWSLFDKDINVSIKKISNDISISSYKNLLEAKWEIINKETSIFIIERIFNKVADFNDADRSLKILINLIEKHKLTTKEIQSVLIIMNTNRQVYDVRRKDRNSQILKLIDLEIDLTGYDNLDIGI